ncbi:MAG: glucose-6-phosphate isomerase, partial [Pseudomonadota bacterium]|nr:glucose-6-phosphate isomerase [Pseudomonadota bacterium]
MLRELNPYNLGSLIALYEHKVFVQSVIWNINAFDQWGVESGKFLSREMFDSLSSKLTALNLDASTNGLIQFTRKWDK